MEITNLSPIIYSNDAASIISLLEELGFERRHHNVIEGAGGVDTVDLVHPDGGFRVDVSQSVRELPRDSVIIRMNVRDFDAAYQTLLDHGYKNIKGDGVFIEDETSKEASMMSPTGALIAVTYHKRK